ncbi:bis(5'-nucleosyl)-tetraphosphatase [Porcipelethomonas sp.]|uniref:bis(5'-nucleosyl)-tetraphosphatase n=1 Tax=Porcipelethomonas sp. TaxID=2981675 RepID=UPI003EF590A6
MVIIKKGEYKNILGKSIKVTPKYKKGDTVPEYPKHVLNTDYGYADGYICENSDPQGVYILADEYTEYLTVIAVIEGTENESDKWVAAPENTVIFEPYIKKQINFYENKQRDEFHCLYEKTCGSVMFTKENNIKKYLLIKNDSGHIGFPKGHIEYGESEIQTAEREVFEETGLKITVNAKTRQEYTYKTLDSSIKNCVYFCNEFKSKSIKIQQEEISQSWLVPFDEAMILLNFPEDRLILEKADRMYD